MSSGPQKDGGDGSMNKRFVIRERLTDVDR